MLLWRGSTVLILRWILLVLHWSLTVALLILWLLAVGLWQLSVLIHNDYDTAGLCTERVHSLLEV